MSMWQASVIAGLLALGGMAALACAMDRHYPQWSGRDEIPLPLCVLLRGGGLLLLASLPVSIARPGAAPAAAHHQGAGGRWGPWRQLRVPVVDDPRPRR